MAKTKTAPKRGTVQVSKGSQSINYVGLFQTGDHKLRVLAEYDSYRDQSSAKIERWSGSEWKEVYTLRGRALQGWQEGIAYRAEAVRDSSFDLDVVFLLARAGEVLGF